PPPGVHPLVRVHPDNGRKFLYLNPVRLDAIIGMEDGAAMALVNELVAHATQQKYEYRHKWVMGDMVIWDDRSVMHQANGDYDMKEVRHLHRIMIKGRLHSSDVEATRDLKVTVDQRLPTQLVVPS